MSKIHTGSNFRPPCHNPSNSNNRNASDLRQIPINRRLIDSSKSLERTIVKRKPTTASVKGTPTPIIINNVEFVPTLEFVVRTPDYACKQQCLQQCNEQLDENSLNSSYLTYTIENTSLTLRNEVEQEKEHEHEHEQQERQQSTHLKSLRRNLLQQEVNYLNSSLNDSEDSILIHECSSSLSILNMESGSVQKTINDTEMYNRSLLTTTPPSNNSEQQSIEEDIEIEEAVAVSELSNKGDGPSGIKTVKELFDSDLSFSDEVHDLQRQEHSSGEGAQFQIDHDQLSGDKLAQHFLVQEEEDNQTSHDESLKKVSLPREHKSSEYEAEFSLNNQSTADDVSELMEEAEEEEKDKSNIEDMNVIESVGAKRFELDIELPDDRVALKKNFESGQLSGTSSIHSEKDHSIDEIVVENQPVELSAEDKNLSSRQNETLTNPLLSDTLKKLNTTNPLSDKSINNSTNKIDSLKNRKGIDNLRGLKLENEKISSQDNAYAKQPHELAKKMTFQNVELRSKPGKTNFENFHRQELQRNLFFQDIDEEQKENISATTLVKLNMTQKVQMITDLDDNSTQQNESNITVEVDKELNEIKDSVLPLNVDVSEEDDEETLLKLMKLKVLAMKNQTKDVLLQLSPSEVHTTSLDADNSIKTMERVSLVEFSKDVLEDITEESERNSLSNNEGNTLSDNVTNTQSDSKTLHNTEPETSTSALNLNLMQQMEQKVGVLQKMLATKDACLASLNPQLEKMHFSESLTNKSPEQLTSNKDSSSLTNSTEYRTFHEDLCNGTLDVYSELSKRDEVIAKLTDSLQQSLAARENLQSESEKLGAEVLSLRKQLNETLDNVRPRGWSRDQESNGGQRISEISMDLVSESDDDMERHYLTDNDDKLSRNSRERQLSMPRQLDYHTTGGSGSGGGGGGEQEIIIDSSPAFSKQMEQFQKYLTPNEVRLFFMVQKKFDDHLFQELQKCKMKVDQEYKLLIEQNEREKYEQQEEIQKLLKSKQEKDKKHTQEMEDLRKYFEHKCADLEKQYSDDVFSQKSQRQSLESLTTSSDSSDQDKMPHDDNDFKKAIGLRSKETSPKKRLRTALLLSPSHRQMTPGNEGGLDDLHKNLDRKSTLEVIELKVFYQNKIHEIQRTQEEQLKKLNERLKVYESSYPENEFLSTACSIDPDNAIVQTQDMLSQTVEEITSTAKDNAHKPPQSSFTNKHDNSNKTALLIIDQDELMSNDNNALNWDKDTQIIQKIIDEYEKRLHEQLTLAKEDIARELEQQVQTLLTETTADDHQWSEELMLLREKFTAKSRLEIVQLEKKHAEEMSRVKLDYEKQLNRKNKRHSTFDSKRDLDRLLDERDSLKELTKSLRHVLAELAKCVANYEKDLDSTLMQEVQRLLSCNKTLEEHDITFDYRNNSSAFFNDSLNHNNSRLMPNVQGLLQLVEDPSLLQYITNKDNEMSADFDLNECLEKLRSEASYLLHLSEDIVKRRRQSHDSECQSSHIDAEKDDTGCEAGANSKYNGQKHLHSLNEQQLPTYQVMTYLNVTQLTSLPPDLNRLPAQDLSSINDNAAELNFQLVELKNRLIKSESDRNKLQKELEYTINRNAELGEELQHLRDQLIQMNSLNTIDFNDGYDLTTTKTPPRPSSAERFSANFVQLQEKARNILSTPPQKQTNNDSTVLLLQMIEDFCREGDKVVECNKKDREDLQSQIEIADKKLKATRQFLEEQATEREQEREEFLHEIERLNKQLREKERECSNYLKTSEEVEHMEARMNNLNQQIQESNAKSDKFEVELKASIDKIFVLREIISDLETQVETKALSEHVLNEKLKELEDYISSQNQSTEVLERQVHSLSTDIEQVYKLRIKQLEDKLQNMRPTAEQSIILDQVVEQLREIENTLEQKTKQLELLHQGNASNSGSLTEDISGPPTKPLGTKSSNIETISPQSSPQHPSPRQHCLTMEGVQRIMDKLSKHTRVEEAAVKRIRDLEMHITQIRQFCADIQNERESLQDRMSEQTQRIALLQSRLEEQRQRAEELQRFNTSGLNIRIHDLQTEIKNLTEKLLIRDKQIATQNKQLEESKIAIDRLEAEIELNREPDRTMLDRVEHELKEKQAENQKLKEKIKNEMINKLALPDLMETMLADKNEEIDHLREQLDNKDRELKSVMETSAASSVAAKRVGNGRLEESGAKLSARTLSDVVSITDFDEPDVMRRAAIQNSSSPLVVPDGSGGCLYQTMETSKAGMANLTYKRTEDLTGLSNIRLVNTFDHPHYFQDPNALLSSAQSGTSCTPSFAPRQINFSALTEDSKLKTPLLTPHNREQVEQQEQNQCLEKEIVGLKEQLKSAINENENIRQHKEKLSEELISAQLRLTNLQDELAAHQKELQELGQENERNKEEIQKLNKEKSDMLSKHEKDLINYAEMEDTYKTRFKEMESNILENTKREMQEKESLREELKTLEDAHEKCKYIKNDNEQYKEEIEKLSHDIATKDERLLIITTKLSLSEEHVTELKRQITILQSEVEKLKQHNSDNSSKQFSVEEIAQQVEKELNYSAQLDSNILKAIESEEENNLDRKHNGKNVAKETPGTTDDENFTGERDLLNQLEALKAQVAVEREQSEVTRQELLQVKQHSQDIQEQDVLIIEAMRKRLEAILEEEDDLHKQLDVERERTERLQTQLIAMQRSESRRNSSLQKSPTESPRKSPRSLTDFESELAERLRSEIKLITAQNERERERSADLQKSNERERVRFEKELQERIEYCEKLKREMDKLSRDKESAELEIEHLQERLTLQTQEIESLEGRISSLQEAETRRFARKDRQYKESAQLMIEIQDLKEQLANMESEKETLNKCITQLRYDVERSARREAKLAEALANSNTNLIQQRDNSQIVPEQFLEKMKEINVLLAENTQENKQMADTVQCLVGERQKLQKKCEQLEAQLNGAANVNELEERCHHLLARYLRVESHRKALVYQKRYLKISLQGYVDNEERALAAFNGQQFVQNGHNKKKLFKIVALAIISIQRMKYIGRIWHTGKRIVSKSIFTITQQRRHQPPAISCATVSSTSMPLNGQRSPNNVLPLQRLKTPSLSEHQTPSSDYSLKAFEWPKVPTKQQPL